MDPESGEYYAAFIPKLVEQRIMHAENGQVVFRCVSRVKNNSFNTVQYLNLDFQRQVAPLLLQ